MLQQSPWMLAGLPAKWKTDSANVGPYNKNRSARVSQEIKADSALAISTFFAQDTIILEPYADVKAGSRAEKAWRCTKH